MSLFTDDVQENTTKPMIGSLVYCERTRVVSPDGLMVRVAETDVHDLFNGHDDACKKCFRYGACRTAKMTGENNNW
jgi:hypothetical protein